jgi:hypothetical protein
LHGQSHATDRQRYDHRAADAIAFHTQFKPVIAGKPTWSSSRLHRFAIVLPKEERDPRLGEK